MNFYPISFPGIVLLPSAVMPIKHIRAEDGKHKRRQGWTHTQTHTDTYAVTTTHAFLAASIGTRMKLRIKVQACCVQTHTDICELKAYTQETDTHIPTHTRRHQGETRVRQD